MCVCVFMTCVGGVWCVFMTRVWFVSLQPGVHQSPDVHPSAGLGLPPTGERTGRRTPDRPLQH